MVRRQLYIQTAPRTCDLSMPRDMSFNFSDQSDIWQASRQQKTKQNKKSKQKTNKNT